MGSPSARLTLALALALATSACQTRRPPPPPDTAPPMAESRRTVVRRTPRPPVIDGVLERLWDQAVGQGGFVALDTGRPAPGRAQLRLLWDPRTLFVAVAGDGEPATGGDLATVLVHGVAIGTGGMEIRVMQVGGASVRYRPDPQGSGGGARPSRVRVATVIQRPAKHWMVEMGIPMADLAVLACARGKVPPAPGDVWGLNVLLGDAAWSRRVAGDPLRLDQLGEMVFVEEGGEDPQSDEGREERERSEEEREQRQERRHR